MTPQLQPLIVRDALRQLRHLCVQHDCGGFSLDDIRWQMYRPFEPDDSMHRAIDWLMKEKMVSFCGLDAADEPCYLTT